MITPTVEAKNKKKQNKKNKQSDQTQQQNVVGATFNTVEDESASKNISHIESNFFQPNEIRNLAVDYFHLSTTNLNED